MGLECQQIDVEVDYRHGLSHFAVVGLGDKSVQESKERIISAIKNSTAEFVPKRIIVNLAPADIPKSGPIFDLAIAAGYLLATGQVNFDPTDKIFLGELALDGGLRPVKGVLALVDGLKKLGFKQIFLPAANVAEAALISGIEFFSLNSLNELIGHFQNQPIPPFRSQTLEPTSTYTAPDLADVKGLLHAKRALEIVAAGGHNLLLYGVPGAGKTYLARCLPGILPAMTIDEALEVTKIYSVSGLLPPNGYLLGQRPFRSPHHTSSRVALIGGGPLPQPGEISLANRGVLFLDEFPEFTTASIEALRQPLEDKEVHIARALGRVSFPANFMLIAAMNPCKCGHWGDKEIACTCSLREKLAYQRRISGPILDRIDVRVRVDKLSKDELLSSTLSESSDVIRQRVQFARERQWQRLQGSGAYTNADMNQKQLKQFCAVDSSTHRLLEHAIQRFSLSARGFHRLLKVARTIADLEVEESIKQQHIAEALSYRQYSLEV